MSTQAASPLQSAPKQGVMERRDPVPAGRYWVYIDDTEALRWIAWERASQGAIVTLVREPQRQQFSAWLPVGTVAGYWILFDVLRPHPWIGIGYPTTVVDASVRSSTDVITAPPPEEWNPFGELLGQAKWLVLVAGAILVASQARSLAQTFGPARSSGRSAA